MTYWALRFRQAHRFWAPAQRDACVALPGWPFGGAAAPYGYDVLETAAAEALAGAVERVQPLHPDVKAESYARCGRAGELLVEAAAGASLLVIGSHRGGRLHDLVFGSVALAAVQHAPCPVLVLPSFRDAGKAVASV